MGQTVSQSVSACKPADLVVDTVQVDATLLSDPAEGPKVQRLAQAEEEEQKEGEAAEEKRREDAEEKRLEEERLQGEEEERRLAEEEQARRQAEEARARAEEEAQAERQRQEECERVAGAERVKAEQARAAAAKERAEAAAAQKTVDEFLKARGFKQLALPRKAFCGASIFPLHMAVEENNAEVVQAMVRCGADLQQKSSSNKTPLEVAEKCNKSGSHALVVAALRRGA